MDYATIIKERISTPQMFSFYGFEIGYKGQTRCMFHEDHSPSMKVYDGDRGYHCFACGAHGDIITFVMQYFSLSFKDAITKLNEDFRLGLPLNEYLDMATRKELAREAEIRRKRRERERKECARLRDAYNSACDRVLQLERQLANYAPKSPTEPPSDLYVEALQKIDYANYAADSAHARLRLYEQETLNKHRRWFK